MVRCYDSLSVNGNNDQNTSTQLEGWYTYMRDREELIDFIEKNSGKKKQ
jgi:hypothetical protein